MSRAELYPGAIQKRTSVRGTRQSSVSKLVLHSTETSAKWGCPGYNGNRNAPTLTIDPWNFISWQHFDANESAKALVDPGSTAVRENRDNVAQVEIIGYSDQNIARTYGFNLRKLPQSGIDFIAKVIAWYHDEWDVPLRIPSVWPMYPASYGDHAARMSGPTYDRYTGVLGHLHVPGNSHGDPAINIKAVMSVAARLAGGDSGHTITPATPADTRPEEDIMASIEDLREAIRAELDSYLPNANLKINGLVDSAKLLPLINDKTNQLVDSTAPLRGPLGTYGNDKLNQLIVAVRTLAARDGVDTAELGRVLAESLRDDIAAAVEGAADHTPDQIADAVVAALGTALTKES